MTLPDITVTPALYMPGDDLPVTYSYRERTWKTLHPIDIAVNGVVVRIPGPGWKTDLASVPVFLRGLPGLNTFELGGPMPPILHDLIYRTRGHLQDATIPPTRFTRRAADRLFRKAMEAEGVGFKRWLAWAAVRAGGWWPWPPSKTFLRQAVVKALHTGWQAGGGVLAVVLISHPGWIVWLAVPVAMALSAAKNLAGVPLSERIAGVVYK